MTKRGKEAPEIQKLVEEAQKYYTAIVANDNSTTTNSPRPEGEELRKSAFISGFIAGSLTYMLINRLSKDFENPLIIGVGRFRHYQDNEAHRAHNTTYYAIPHGFLPFSTHYFYPEEHLPRKQGILGVLQARCKRSSKTEVRK